MASSDAFSATGLTGATVGTRYVGATASGAPTFGAFLIGDFAVDRSGATWVCTAAGQPGTWVTPSPSAASLPAATTTTQGAVILDGTAADILGEGNQAAGSNAKAADSGHIHPASSVTPADQNMLAWSYDLDAAGQAATLTAGTIYLSKIPIRYALTATTLWFSTGAAGSGVSTGSFVGLYSSAGTLLSGSADLGTSIFAGNWSQALTTPQALSAGTFVWAAILVNQASSQPSVGCIYNFTGSNRQNIGLTAANYRAAVPAGGTSRTTLLGSFTPSSNSVSGIAPLWFGIS